MKKTRAESKMSRSQSQRYYRFMWCQFILRLYCMRHKCVVLNQKLVNEKNQVKTKERKRERKVKTNFISVCLLLTFLVLLCSVAVFSTHKTILCEKCKWIFSAAWHSTHWSRMKQMWIHTLHTKCTHVIFTLHSDKVQIVFIFFSLLFFTLFSQSFSPLWYFWLRRTLNAATLPRATVKYNCN